ncbi:TPA: type II toxin-antitoxin system HicA family toxin [Candidatus Poribacteria bacterium]|nr:type II toxin-antitoxin system HicA family toxin [Candidatus Poribacteria bacterium]
MPIYTYDQMRYVLKKLNFELIRKSKHETWQKVLENGVILQVRISHKGKRDIPRGTFYEMLRQAGIDETTFKSVLKD